MGRARVTSLRLRASGLIGAVILVAGACTVAAPTSRPWTDFLADVEAGSVVRVEVRGSELVVFRGARIAYAVAAPNVLTNLPGEIRHAADRGDVPMPEVLVYASPP